MLRRAGPPFGTSACLAPSASSPQKTPPKRRRHQVPSRAALVAVATLPLVSCAGSKPSASNTSDSPLSPHDSSALLSLDEGERSQETILADGVVSRDEMNTAYEAAVRCLSSFGYDAALEIEYDRVFGISVDYDDSAGKSEEQMDGEISGCIDAYTSEITPVWNRQIRPSEEELEAAVALLKDCVAPYGVAVQLPIPEGLQPLFTRLEQLEQEGDETEYTTLAECLNEFSLRAGSL